MKTVAKTSSVGGTYSDIIRVKDKEAPNYIKKGYKYVPKKLWKENVRDKE